MSDTIQDKPPVRKCPLCDGRQDQPSWFLFRPEATTESVCYNAESKNCLLCREPECNLSGMDFSKEATQDESPRTLHIRYIILPAILLGAWALYAFLVYMVFNTELSKSSDGFIISVLVSCLMALGWLPLTALILDALELPHLGRFLAKIGSWLGKYW